MPLAALLLAALLLAALPGLVQAKDATLVFQPTKTPVKYEISLQQEMTFMGVEQLVNGKGTALVSPGEASTDGNARFVVELSGIEVTLKQGEELQDLDLGLEGKKVNVTVTPRGDVVSVEPTTPADGMSTGAIKSLVKTLFPYLPEGKVSEGATWTHKRLEANEDKTIKEPAIDGQFDYTLEEFGNKDGVETAKILGEGKVKINQTTPGGVFVGEAEGQSELHVGVKDGWIVHNKADMTVSGKVGTTEITRVERFECKRAVK
jgi:hypothetical protein